MRYGRAMRFVAQTEWFAVDSAGRIARFDTGEDGARPVQAAVGRGPEEPSFDPVALDCARLAAMLAAGHDPCEGWNPSPSPGWQVAVLDDDEPLAGFRFIGAEPRVAVSDERLDQEAVEALAERARWTLPEADLHEALEGAEGLDGLYVYRRAGEPVGRYERVMVPAEPLDASALVEPLETTNLALEFATTEVLDLADHLEDAAAVLPEGRTLRPPDEPEPGTEPSPRIPWLAIAAAALLALLAAWYLTGS